MTLTASCEGCDGLVVLLLRFLQLRLEVLDLVLEFAGLRLLMRQFVQDTFEAVGTGHFLLGRR